MASGAPQVVYVQRGAGGAPMDTGELSSARAPDGPAGPFIGWIEDPDALLICAGVSGGSMGGATLYIDGSPGSSFSIPDTATPAWAVAITRHLAIGTNAYEPFGNLPRPGRPPLFPMPKQSLRVSVSGGTGTINLMIVALKFGR